jgi:hypothetical protein
MLGRDQKAEPEAGETTQPLKQAMREARIEAAERSAVVVDLRDAELARLELLNDALNPVFAEVPSHVDLFDRGISQGDVPRLWIDAIAHVEMGRDKRLYRFLQDTRYGRTVLAESHETVDITEAVTHYIARRLVEREQSLADDAARAPIGRFIIRRYDWHRGWRAAAIFGVGALVGMVLLFLIALLRS